LSAPSIHGRGLYAYGVVPAHATIGQLVGLGDAEVGSCGHDSLALVVSVIEGDVLVRAQDSSDPEAFAALARCHDAVVRAAQAVTDAILPLRLGTVLRDESAARRYLASRQRGLRRGLRHVEHRQEWGIEVAARRDATVVDLARPTPALEGLGAGAAYLARRRLEIGTLEAQRRERAQLLHDVEQALQARSVEVASGQRRTSAIVLAASYLVDRDHEAQFLEVVDTCGDRLSGHGLRLRATGPWPPYSFVRVLGTQEVHD
jgi:hypothetical protein